MAVLAGTVVVRDAPGRPFEFFTGCNNTPNSNDTFFIDTAPDSLCGMLTYNITDSFPACEGEEFVDLCNSTSCIYADFDLQALCNETFWGLVPNFTESEIPRCRFGLLNNFQVRIFVNLPPLY